MLVKSVRNALIGFVVLGFALYWSSRGEADELARGIAAKANFVWEKFPKFVLGFLAVSTLATAHLLSKGQIANLGNMPLYPFRGPGVNNWNTSLFKNFSIRERLRVQFRAEAYNTFNHTQFDGVDTTITFNAAGQNTRTTSGQLNSSRDPRIMQFALRLMF